ncbi:histidinol-phosphate transaminase [Inmirania thermothiophila]|uniref:Histidinol-phosphate aminotransferase n=1 Tax=Inmirania thermothiophila TaxID=1750597 RepID=A0A3N1Y0B5_9GAMM|nr:histidinol-phosphate transaminase [Inmirania thermothiophila]ROR32293.1 histidinol-phosphate aminotransferase [Inmirania thermothiophila]
MTDNAFLRLAHEGVRRLRPYQPGKPLSELERELGIRDAVKLASNENPLGPSPRALEAARAALAEAGLYPDGNGFELRAAIAARHDVDPACITLGNGSNDVLDLVARVFLGPGREAVFSEHGFVVYWLSTLAANAVPRMVPAHDGSRGPRRGHDLEAMRAAVGEATGVVYVANPNNPTGTWLRAAELEGFLAELPRHVIAVVDEAYFEYVEEPDYPDASRWLGRFPNLVVTRTFSKAHGLAALRVGYALSHPDVADLLNRVRQPFNVNHPAQAAAVAALGDADHVARSVAMNRAGMRQLEEGLRALGLHWIPSVGNFVTVDVGRPAAEVFQALLREGVIVRPVEEYGLPGHLRITVGTEAQNRRALEALGRVL